MENCDFMPIDDQLVTLNLHLTLVAAVGGVILEHVDLKKKCKENYHMTADKSRGNLKGLYSKPSSSPTMYSRSMKGSLMATISTFLEVKAALVTRRPMRPNLKNKW